jgi:hypothetical protein
VTSSFERDHARSRNLAALRSARGKKNAEKILGTERSDAAIKLAHEVIYRAIRRVTRDLLPDDHTMAVTVAADALAAVMIGSIDPVAVSMDGKKEQVIDGLAGVLRQFLEERFDEANRISARAP